MTDSANASTKRVVLVGHCGADTGLLRRAIASIDEQIAVDAEYDQQAAEASAAEGSLLLINRVLDGRFDSSNGVDLIKHLKAKNADSKLILVSNYADSQQSAQEAGALKGFGKSEVGSDTFKSRLAAGLGRSSATA